MNTAGGTSPRMEKVGRNDPCPCGSGKKYKRCCLEKNALTGGRETAAPAPSAFLTNASQAPPVPRDAHTWPVVRACAPVGDVWEATGLGTAYLERRRPNGRSAWVMAKLNLREHGISVVSGKLDDTPAEARDLLETMRDLTPPFEEAPLELVSAYLWGAWALGEAKGSPLPPGTAESFLALVPRPPGAPQRWVAQLVGPDGLTPARLVELIASLPDHEETHEGSEIAIATSMWFQGPDEEDAVSLLQANRPGPSGFRFIPGEPPEDGEGFHFELARPLPEGPRSIMPVRDGLQIQGHVRIEGDEIVATAMSLSMAARLAASLREVLGAGRVTLVETSWMGPEAVSEAMAQQARR